MLRLHNIWWAVALAAAVWVGAARPAGAVQTGSFMKRPAASLSAFLAQVRADAVLQKRYGKHLGLDGRAVPEYLAGRLRPDTVKRAAFFTIYNVSGHGEIYPTKQRLAAGTRIYRIANSKLFFTTKGDPGRPFFVPVVERVRPAPARPAPAAPVEPREEVIIIHVPSE